MKQPVRICFVRFLILCAALVAGHGFNSGAWAQVSLTTINSPYTQDFNTLSNTAGSTTNTTLPTGFFLTESGGGARDNEQYAVDTGTSTTGDTYSYGTAAATDRAFGGLRSGTLIPIIGAAFTNNTGTTISSLSITYTGEEWRLGTAARTDRLDFQYSTNATDLVTGTYVDVDALDFSTPSQTTTGAKDGNAAANRTVITSTITSLSIAPGATFWIRFADLDATGADDGLAIDDFSITPISAGPVLPTVTIAATDAAAAEAGTDPGTFRVSRTGATTDGLTVNYTVGGTASSADYNPALAGTLVIPTGQSFADITITPVNDTDVEGSETVVLALDASANYTVGAAPNNAATVTIADDDAPVLPNLSINDVTLAEGNSGTTTFTFTVTLSEPAPTNGVTFDIATLSGTASVADSDFQGKTSMGQTIPSGSSTFTFDVLVNGDTKPETDETFFVNVTNVTGANVTDGQGLGTIVNDDATPATLISTIQGTGTAATAGTFTIEGIVVGVFNGTQQLGGFYVQEEDADSDNNPATSEGISVLDPNGVFTGTQGDKVRIAGPVGEFTSASGGVNSSLTQLTLTAGTNFTVVSSNNALPAITTVTLPVANVSDLERYEGMLVTVGAATGNLTVTDNFTLGRFGQVTLSATDPATNQPGTDPRIEQYTQFNLPGVAGNAAYQTAIAKRRIILDDASGVANPPQIIHARGGNPLSGTNTLRTGDDVASVTGILDERFDGYRIQTNVGINFNATNPRLNAPSAVGGTMKVMGLNVLNYFTDLDMNQTVTVPNGGGVSFVPRGAETAEEFTRQRDKIIAAITAASPDVLGVIEMENNGNTAIGNLVDGLNAISGPGTYSFVDDANLINDPNSAPGAVGTDAIKVGLIYKPASVSAVGLPMSSSNAIFSRPPVAQTFLQRNNGAKFSVIVNHFKSKGSGTGANADQNDGQGASNADRVAQANALISFVPSVTAAAGDPDVLMLGDYNAYALEDPIRALATAGFASVRPNDDYSYAFGGQFGFLDYAFTNTSLSTQISGSTDWHINSDEPIILDYNTNFKQNQPANLYNADAFRASDHDAVVVGLSLTPSLSATLVASTSVCAGSPASFSLTVAGLTTGATYSYTITNGTNSTTASGVSASAIQTSVIPTVVGSFTATVFTSTNASATAASGNVTINALPTNASLSSGTLTCTATSVTLTASATGGTSYTLSDGQTNMTGVFVVSTAGNYTATIANASGCTATATATVVSNTAAPTSASLTSGTLTCATTSVTLTASATGGTSYTLSDGQSNTTGVFVVSTAGNYTVTISGANGCTATATATVVSNTAAPTNTSLTSGTLTCTNTSVTLTASATGGTSYTLSDGQTNMTGVFVVSTAGNYTVTISGANGCTATATATVTNNTTAPTNASLTSGTLTCTTTSVTLTASATGGTSYTLNGGTGPQTNTTGVFVVSTAGNYTVTISGANGCTATATSSVVSNTTAPTNASLTSGTLTCTTTSVTLTASATGGTSYTLNGGTGPQTNTTGVFVVSTAGNYTAIIANASGCTAVATATVTNNTTAPTNASLTSGTLTCTTTSVTLTASATGGTSYTLSNGQTNMTGVFVVSTAGNYTVTISGANGCTATATATVTNNTTAPTNASLTSGTLTCTTTSVTLTASATGGTSYTLNGGTGPQTNTTGVFVVSTAGNYTAIIANASGCTAVATATVVSNTAAPTSASLTSGTLTCATTSVTLTASATGGTSYTLNGGTGPQTNTTGVFVVSTAGNYTVTISGANGCTASATSSVVSNTTAPTNASLTSGTLTCAQTSVTLTASATGGTSYTLNGGTGPQTNTTGVFVVSTAGNYTAIIANANGCTATATATVVSNTAAPTATLTASTNPVCAPASVTITAGGTGTSYTFSASATQIGTTNQAIVTQSGTYSVTVSNASGCTATASVSVTVNTPPSAPTLTAVSRTVTQSNTPLPLGQFVSATGTLSFSGVNGLLNPPNANISQVGTQSFSVTQSDANGCVSAATPFTITVQPSTPTTPGSQTACRSSVVVLNAITTGVRYEWYKNGQTAPFKMTEIASIQKGTATSSLTLVSIQTTASYYVKVFQANGSFTFDGPFVVTVNYGCVAPGARVAAAEVVEVPLSITLTPNPIVDGQLRAVVRGAAGQALSVELLDLRGSIVRSQNWSMAESEQQIDWNIATQSTGLYLLRVQTADQLKTVKVLKQ